MFDKTYDLHQNVYVDLYSGPVARNAVSFTTGVVMKSELHGVPCTRA